MALGHFQPKKPTVKGSAKFLIKRAVVAAAPGWISALVIILPILLLFLVVISILGAAASSIPFANELGLGSTFHPTSIPTPTPNPNPDPDPDCGPSNNTINSRLRSDFGLIIKEGGNGYQNGGDQGAETLDCETRKLIYRAYAIPGRSTRFMSLLNPNNTFELECYRDSRIPGSSGWTPWGGKLIQFKNCSRIKVDFQSYAFLFLHETGHLLKHRNYRELQQNFPRTRLIREDPNCFANEGVIKTYNRRGLTPYSLTSESSAEAIALFVYNEKVGDYATISNFKNDCNSIYAWTLTEVYGGYLF